jgi:hypothetical protein
MVDSSKSQMPVVAFLTILDKQNQPIISRNYLCDHLLAQQQQGYDHLINIDSLRMQMSMLIYATIDVLEEK